MLAVIGVFDFIGTIGSGWLSDRYDNRALLFFYYGLRGLSLIYLPVSSFSVVDLSLFAVFYGLDWVATVRRPCVCGRTPSAATHRRDLRLDLRRPPGRRGDRRLRRRLHAQGTADLPPALYVAGRPAWIAGAGDDARAAAAQSGGTGVTGYSAA